MRELMERRALRAIEERVFPGCVVGISQGGSRAIFPVGDMIYHINAPVREDTIYDLASVTKSIPLASLAAMLAAEGTLSLRERVTTYLPELQRDHGAVIEDLLRYRVHGVALSRLKVSTFEEIRSRALESGFASPPGEERYTNLPAFILGLAIERAAGESIAALAHRRFFEPLSMSDTTFFPHDTARCAPTEIDARGEVRAMPHDESAYLFAQARRSAGHAGLFSTVPDLLTFLEALIVGKFRAVVDAAERGLGWSVHEPYFMGAHAGQRTFGKTGFTGTSILCDIERQTALVILSNRTFPHRAADHGAINAVRADIADIVLGGSRIS